MTSHGTAVRRGRTAAALLLLGLAAAARGGEGHVQIAAADLPCVITNRGTYLLTEDVFFEGTGLPFELLVPSNSVWSYRDDGADLGTAWTGLTYDASGWASGPGELGFGDGGESTVVNGGPATNRHMTLYFRHAFAVTNISRFIDLDLFLRRDDGAVVYLNGKEVVRNNLPDGEIAYATAATNAIANGTGETTYYEFDVWEGYLVEGTNLLAVEVHQSTNTSTDLSFDLQLNGDTALASAYTNGITIAADFVTLDLGGHAMQGHPASTLDGIAVPGGNNVVIRNGTLAGWGQHGIGAGAATNLTVCDVAANANAENGIMAGPAARLLRCDGSMNGVGQTVVANDHGNGLVVDVGSLLRGCTARGNNNHGIESSSSCDLEDCLVSRNGHDGIHGGMGSTAVRCLAYENTGEGIEFSVGSTIADCTAYSNDDGIKTRAEPTAPWGHSVFARNASSDNNKDGFVSQNASLFAWNSAFNNGDDGIEVAAYGLLVGNTCGRNGFTQGGTPGGGITLQGARNQAAGNVLLGNENGLGLDNTSGKNPASNVVVRNLAMGNATNYHLPTATLLGPRTNAPSATNAWVNFQP